MGICLGRSVKVSVDELRKIEPPRGTTTWYPIPHFVLAERVREALMDQGYRVSEETHGVSQDGIRYFGVFESVGKFMEEYNLAIGLRNFNDKKRSAGISVGSHVFVCDNLAFTGEIVLRRKHTRFIERDLPGMIAEGGGDVC